jgi:predicted ATP-grasp superfamily ATP-dependent carboligase
MTDSASLLRSPTAPAASEVPSFLAPPKSPPDATSSPRADEEEAAKLPYPGASCRLTVSGEFKYGAVRLRELAGADKTNGAPILESFPGLGVTSTIVAGYILEQLRLPLVGVFTSDTFPSMGLIHSYNGMPPVRVYGDERLVLFCSEFKIAANNPDVVNNLGEAVLDWAARHNSATVVSIDGLPLESLDKKTMEAIERKMGVRRRGGSRTTPVPTGDNSTKESKDQHNSGADKDEQRFVSFMTNSESWAKMFLENKCKPIQDAMVPSLTGFIISEATFCKQDVVCLLAPVSKLFPDAWGAVNVIQMLDLMYPSVAIDIKPLEKKARELESKITSTMNEAIREQMLERQSNISSMYA